MQDNVPDDQSAEPGRGKRYRKRGAAGASRRREEYLLRMGDAFEAARKARLLSQLGGLRPNEMWTEGGVVTVPDDEEAAPSSIPDLFADLPRTWQLDGCLVIPAPFSLGLPSDTTLSPGDTVEVLAVAETSAGAGILALDPCAPVDEGVAQPSSEEHLQADDVERSDHSEETSSEASAPAEAFTSVRYYRLADNCQATRSGMTQQASTAHIFGKLMMKSSSLSGTKGKKRRLPVDACVNPVAFCNCRACNGFSFPPRRRCGNLCLQLVEPGGITVKYRVISHDGGWCPPRASCDFKQRHKPPLGAPRRKLAGTSLSKQ